MDPGHVAHVRHVSKYPQTAPRPARTPPPRASHAHLHRAMMAPRASHTQTHRHSLGKKSLRKSKVGFQNSPSDSSEGGTRRSDILFVYRIQHA